MLIVYAFFFASTNLCYHSHEISGEKIIHSHMGYGYSHDHSNNQIQILEIISASVTDCPDTIILPDNSYAFSEVVAVLFVESRLGLIQSDGFYLRAPPVCALA